jgi:hypothetical protein
MEKDEEAAEAMVGKDPVTAVVVAVIIVASAVDVEFVVVK